jgi:signal transduction histidine kinase
MQSFFFFCPLNTKSWLAVMRGVLIILLFVPASLLSQVILRSSDGAHSVNQIYYFHTNDRDVDILEAQQRDFEPLPEGRFPSLGFNRSVNWFRFDLLNQTRAREWYLEVGYPQLDHLEVYSPDRLGNWSLQFSGDLYPVSSRPIRHRNFVFPLSVESNLTTPLLVKVVTSSSVQLPITIWSPEAFRNSNADQQFINGLFYGVMLIMIFYNLLLYFSMRDRSTLLYAVALLAGINIIAFLHGYGFYYIYPENPEWNALFATLSTPFFIVASIALTRSFLGLKSASWKADRGLIALGVVTAVVAVLTMALGDSLSFVPLNVLAVLDFVFILFSTMLCFFRGYRPARLFLLAWVGILVLGSIIALQNLGFLQGSWVISKGLYFGVVLETLILSLAMTDRINVLRRHYKEAKEQQLQSESQARVKLEQEVLLRTEEIVREHLQLEATNAVKDKLFSVVSHDLKGPLKTLKGLMDGVQLGALSREELQDLMKRIGEQLNVTSDFLDNLLQWSRTQLQGESFIPQKVKFSMRELVQQCARLLAPEFDRKRIQLTLTVNNDAFVMADPNMIETVVRNLMSNSLKFTQPGGRVEVIVSRQDELVRVDVRDNGIGIPADSLDKLFTLQGVTTAGTREEKGTGIGLVVCKEFIERNNGRIKATSHPGTGSMFSFTVPTR